MVRGRVDVLPRTLCTERRSKEIDYLGPIGYQTKFIEFLVKPGKEKSIREFEDLKKIKVGSKKGTFYFKEFSDAREIKK